MMKIYPYKLYIVETSDAVFDERGMLLPSNEKLVFKSYCRNYSAGNSNITNSETKEVANVSSMIMLPLSCPNIDINSLIIVKGSDNEERLKGNVVRFERNQLHCRIWV